VQRRHYRPAFLLQCVVFAFVIGLAFAAFEVARLAQSSSALLIAVSVGGVLFLLSDLIVGGIVAVLTRQARKAGEESSAFWRVDSEASRQLEVERFHEDTKDNPTLR
jgi:hypothetical protein